MEFVIFGAGLMGTCIKRGLEKYYSIHIRTIFDNDESKWGKKIDDAVISPPQKLIDIEKVFVCIGQIKQRKAVEMQLINLGIPGEKIEDMAITSEYKDAIIEIDPVRNNWIKAFAEHTKEVGMLGSVAECGVYYGDTAIFINKYWPDRTLHLFDTFEGFPDEDLAYDMNTFSTFRNESPLSTNPFKTETPDSIIEILEDRMYYPENLKIHKGYFPTCAGDVEDKFCFVNLDMDLFQPQLGGLRFFWNKMIPGGIILLHDYYVHTLPGVKMAVTEFEKELGGTLLKFPIGDDSSIAVIKH